MFTNGITPYFALNLTPHWRLSSAFIIFDLTGNEPKSFVVLTHYVDTHYTHIYFNAWTKPTRDSGGDAEAHACGCCLAPFSTANRKHHCRFCGDVVCLKCSVNQLMRPVACCGSPPAAAVIISVLVVKRCVCSDWIGLRSGSQSDGRPLFALVWFGFAPCRSRSAKEVQRLLSSHVPMPNS